MSTLLEERSPLIILTTDQARQGVTGHNVRFVLGFGIAAAVMSLVAIGILTDYGWLGTPG
jgi:hypothetical protein